MKKTLVFVITSIVLLTFVFSSCNKQKSLQERLQEEKRAISRYIDRNRLVILDEYPQNGVFKEKEFFKTSDGLYIHVVDSGNGIRVTPMKEEVTVRFDYRHDIAVSDSSIIKWTNSGLINPYSFVVTAKSGSASKYGLLFMPSGSLVCEAWVYPLSYVGEHAVVDLIVPSALGSSSDNSSINPVFYKGVTYTNFY